MSSRALSLYRSILRLHRQLHEPELRSLGDAYVRDEFKKHKNAAPQFVETFLTEWERYAAMMASQVTPHAPSGLGGLGGAGGGDGGGIGRDLSAADMEAMTDEQKEQLEELRREAGFFAAERAKRRGDGSA
mmetsp:Transcript_5691/g.20428  ORF Transcript_5691/g.20428 Transcript_5691/m.20428 type:complete len:131 (-) Transcript_5691:416-808(-)